MTRNISLDFFERQIVTAVPRFYIGHGRRIYSAGLQDMMMFSYIGRHMLSGGEVFRKMLNDDGDDIAAHPFIGLVLSAVVIPGEFFPDTVASVFHDSPLAEGRLRWRGLTVDPAAITDTALLTIEAEQDDIAAPGQTYIAHELCRSIPPARQAHHLQSGIGHFGLFHGDIWRRAIRPRLSTFITAHDHDRHQNQGTLSITS